MSKLLVKCGRPGLLLLLFFVVLWIAEAQCVPPTVFRRKSATSPNNDTSSNDNDDNDAGNKNNSNSDATTPGRGPSLGKLAVAAPLQINESEYEDDQYEEIGVTRSDEYIYDLLESLMLTIQEKLRRSESTENTCKSMLEQMSKRLNAMEDKFEYRDNRIDVVVAKLRAVDAKLLRMAGSGSGAEGSLDVGLRTLDSKVDALGAKLTELKDDVIRDKRGTVAAVATPLHDGDLAAQSSERRDFIKDKSGRNIQLVVPEAEEKVTKDIESVKATLTNLDSRIQYWMQQVSTTANGIAQSIGDLHDAIMEPAPMSHSSPSGQRVNASDNDASDELDSDSSRQSASTSGARFLDPSLTGDEIFVKETKLDKLFRKIHPIIRATEKMDEMWNVVLGTQRLVDDSLQKSDQLLTNSYRQVQSLTDVKAYLAHQTGKIMQNLEQVEEWLKEQGTGHSNIDPKVLTQGIKDILNKTAHLRELQNAADFIKVTNRSSGEEEPQPEAEAYHQDSELTKEGRKIQALEPKSVSVSYARHNATTLFKRKLVTTAPLVTATTKKNGSEHENLCPLQGPPGTNCADLRNRGVTKSGVYYILIKGTTYWFMKVYCDMDTDGGGWTVIQRRDDFGHPRENFIRDWNDYKNGFGDMKREFWLGNENVFMLTNQEDYSLRVDLQDFDSNRRYAVYTKFKIDSEAENYKLEIGGYEGNAADSLNDPWYGSNLSPFSTYDRDNDRSSLNCASMLRGGWWWRSCGRGLNGIYLTNPTDLAARQGIVWFRWRGWDYTMKKASMSIRPKSFVPSSSKG